jgi:CDP-diacylglycerol--glycerol-3-phosphate 3-phosphatidyltransferase
MLPNLITLSRVVLAAAFAVVIAVWADDSPISTRMLAVLLGLAFLEELTDHLDGRIARATGQVTPLGRVLDPLADSVSRLTIYFALSLAWWVTLAVPLVMVARDILVSYTRVINAMSGSGKVSARLSGKLKAIVQCAGIFALVVLAWLPGRGVSMDWVIRLRNIVAATTIAVTLWSLLDYLAGAGPAIRDLIKPQRDSDTP